MTSQISQTKNNVEYAFRNNTRLWEGYAMKENFNMEQYIVFYKVNPAFPN